MNSQAPFNPIPAPPPLVTRLGWPDRLLIAGFCVVQLVLAAALLLIGYHVLAARDTSRHPLRDEAALLRSKPQPSPAAESRPLACPSLPPAPDASSPFSSADAEDAAVPKSFAEIVQRCVHKWLKS